MLKLSFVPVHENPKTGTNFPSIQPATFIGLLIRPDASFYKLHRKSYGVDSPRGPTSSPKKKTYFVLNFAQLKSV